MNKSALTKISLLLLLQGTTGQIWAQTETKIYSDFLFSNTSSVLILGLLTAALLLFWLKWKNQRVQKRMDTLTKEVEALRAENDILQQFNAVAMHDLKSPLRTMTSFTNLFLRKYGRELTKEGEEYLNFVKKSGKRLEQMLDGIPVSGYVSRFSDKSELDLNAVFAATIENLYWEIKNKSAEVILVKKPLPRMIGHQGQVLQLFQNIIGNGLKYVAPGCRPVITVDYSEEADVYTFAIKDNGIGIAPENQERVFQRHTRLHSSDSYEGSGLGLASCQQIIDSMEGQIWLESALGKGTTVFFTLPKIQQNESLKIQERDIKPDTPLLRRLGAEIRAAIF